MATLIIKLADGRERWLAASDDMGIADLVTIREALLDATRHSVTFQPEPDRHVTIFRHAVTEMVWIP